MAIRTKWTEIVYWIYHVSRSHFRNLSQMVHMDIVRCNFSVMITKSHSTRVTSCAEMSNTSVSSTLITFISVDNYSSDSSFVKCGIFIDLFWNLRKLEISALGQQGADLYLAMSSVAPVCVTRMVSLTIPIFHRCPPVWVSANASSVRI